MSWTLLVIDDDEKLNKLLKRFLGDFDFRVFTAVNPEEGLKKIRTTDPDLIILDVMLPGMSGFDVCKRIRQSSTIPIIMLVVNWIGSSTCNVSRMKYCANARMPYTPARNRNRARSNRQ